MADNAEATCRAIVDYLGRKLGLSTEFIDGIPWQEREALLDGEQIQVCWICGLPYVWKADRENPAIELCAVPVMRGERYRGRAVYFSDVVVHRDSAFASFTELRGSSWAYNERRSHSGYNVVRDYLAKLGHPAGYFGKVVESGAHQASLRMVINREIDASAIDSTVLEAELRRFPEFAQEIRVVVALGPSPMPPWVVLKSLPAPVRRGIRAALLEMHDDPDGAQILQGWGIARFAVAADTDYDPLRSMANAAAEVTLAAS